MSKTFKAPQDFEEGPAPFIAMDSVESNQVKAIGYDPETKTLAVTFTRGLGATYHYPDVSQETYEAFIAAESAGTFFGQHIKDLPFKKYRGEHAPAL